MGEKISIAEARVRRSDPVWRRRHKVADVTGIALVVLLIVLPAACGALFRPLGVAMAVALLVAAPAALWRRGPTVGLERRTAFLVAIPLLGLFVLVPAVWRAAHLHLQHWQGPLEPPWGDTVWLLASIAGVVLWLTTVGGLLVSLV